MDTVAELTLFKKGAEASLYLAEWHGRKVVIKVRIPKKYRPEPLDKQIRSYRTVHEPQLMHEAKAAGVPTPLIYLINVPQASIIMEFVEGQQIKQLLNKVPQNQRRELCISIGELIGKLHKQGLIHGDLTTSNMILSPERKIFFVDFGLGEKNSELEAGGCGFAFDEAGAAEYTLPVLGRMLQRCAVRLFVGSGVGNCGKGL